MEGVGSANHVNLNPGSTVIHGAYLKEYVTKGRSLSPMAKIQLNFYERYTPFNRCPIGSGLLKKEVAEMKLGFKNKDGSEDGWLSTLLSVSFIDNPDAAIGKDAEEIKLEELSNFPNLEKSLETWKIGMENGDKNCTNNYLWLKNKLDK